MKLYQFRKKSSIQRVFAEEHSGILVWPKTNIPFLDKEAYTAHPRADEIDGLIRKAEAGDESALKQLWCNEEILKLALRVSDAV